jgi:predicted transcriptional regulator
LKAVRSPKQSHQSKEDLPPMETNKTLIELAAQIVAAYVGHNAVEQADLPKLIGEVHKALEQVAAGTGRKDEGPDPKPPVSVKKSITPDYLICLEDGKKFKSLKRHLRTHFNLTPEQYREKWGLPADYPMVAPNYANSRSNLAKNMGLGQRKAR